MGLVHTVVLRGERAAVVHEVEHNADAMAIERRKECFDGRNLGPQRENGYRNRTTRDSQTHPTPRPSLAHLREEMKPVHSVHNTKQQAITKCAS